jgi:hypothetical protein
MVGDEISSAVLPKSFKRGAALVSHEGKQSVITGSSRKAVYCNEMSMVQCHIAQDTSQFHVRYATCKDDKYLQVFMQN